MPSSETQTVTAEMADAYSAWLAGFRQRALGADVAVKTFDGALAGVQPDLGVVHLAKNQAEHTRTTEDYVSRAVSEERLSNGRKKLEELSSLLGNLEARYGVPRTVLVAIWGLESRYGADPGTRSVLRSLASLAAFDARRARFWEKQLLAALRIVEAGDIAADAMTGSWAGAMGHTQFIPTTFEAYAVDHDGDGKRDIWSNEADALASAADYLKRSGWARGLPWGWEVTLPAGFDYAGSGLARRQPMEAWKAAGVRLAGGRNLPDAAGEISLIVPQGAPGPAFLVTRNFRAVLRYNNAVPYALAVSHLADRLGGGGPLAGDWPDVVPLTRAQRLDLQRRLVALGYDTGGIDGILGTKSVQAIRSEQRARGLPEDGFADAALFKRLQTERIDMTNRSGDNTQ
ncbi:MAG: lytic murein transglycosylase [Hyphomicrobiaceae bacterium]